MWRRVADATEMGEVSSKVDGRVVLSKPAKQTFEVGLVYGSGVSVVCAVFFFQAEDGIRDLTVTGVQTCALPICTKALEDGEKVLAQIQKDKKALDKVKKSLQTLLPFLDVALSFVDLDLSKAGDEIGRASCRERV